jgi:hypothetical protein
MLRRHFVGFNPLPERACRRLARFNRQATLAAGQRRLGAAQIQLSLRRCPTMATQAPFGQSVFGACSFPITTLRSILTGTNSHAMCRFELANLGLFAVVPCCKFDIGGDPAAFTSKPH